MLSEAQRSSLAARLRQGREHAIDVIPRRGPEVRELPLSFGQEQLWFVTSELGSDDNAGAA